MDLEDCGHWPECETCPKAFRTNVARKQHMNAMGPPLRMRDLHEGIPHGTCSGPAYEGNGPLRKLLQTL